MDVTADGRALDGSFECSRAADFDDVVDAATGCQSFDFSVPFGMGGVVDRLVGSVRSGDFKFLVAGGGDDRVGSGGCGELQCEH